MPVPRPTSAGPPPQAKQPRGRLDPSSTALSLRNFYFFLPHIPNESLGPAKVPRRVTWLPPPAFAAEASHSSRWQSNWQTKNIPLLQDACHSRKFRLAILLRTRAVSILHASGQ